MKIDFYRHSLLSRGGDKMTVIHANHLAAIGHEVRIITAVIDTVFEIDPRVTVTPLSTQSKIGTILAALTTKFDSDLVVADIIAMVCLLSFRNRKKLVCFAQDYDESYYTSTLAKLLIRLVYVFSLTLLRIPAIAVSVPLAKLLKDRFRANVTVVENGVDTSIFFSETDSELVTAKGGRTSVLLLSRSDPRKGFDIAIEVIKRVSNSCHNSLEVWTVGEKCQGCFTDFVHRDFGYVGEAHLRRIMSSADLLLYPTRHEGFGLMPLEAMTCGCAVVTTAALPYAEDNRNALVAPINDVDCLVANLKKLLEDDLLRNLLVKNARTFAGTVTLEASVDKFQAALLDWYGK